jgi:glycosyltransferase involved in cell wall biosynthesis
VTHTTAPREDHSANRSPLHVLLIGNYLNDQQESMQSFATVLAKELPKHGVEVETCNPTPVFGRLRPSAFGLGKWFGYIDKFVVFPFALRRRISRRTKECRDQERKFLVHICDHSNAPYTRYLDGIPHLVTCHDLLAIRSARGEIKQNVARQSGRLLQSMILNGLNRADRLACVSKATSNDLLRLSNLSASQARVIYNGQNHPYRPVPLAAARMQIAQTPGVQMAADSSYILHVGGNHWYKNRVGVLEIYAALRRVMAATGATRIPKLVMIGPERTSEMDALVTREPELSSEVIFLHGVSNEVLGAFYSAAELLLFPSLEEGFGWPITEAQACGCRVVTTGKAPMTEVGGDAAVYLSPADVDGTDVGGSERAARIIADLLNEDDVSRQRRIARGLENADRFSTAEMIRQYVETYQEITAQPSAEVGATRAQSVAAPVSS